MQPDAEHQENHADLRELFGERDITDKSRRVRTNDIPRDEISDDRRQADALGEQSENQCGRQPERDRGDEIDLVHAPRVAMRLDHAQAAVAD